MMGITHAGCGTLAFGGATLAYRFGLTDLALGFALTTGAAMINDLDHHNGTMTKALGPLSWLASKLIILIFGPHRHGTHSLAFVIVLGLGAQIAVNYRQTVPGVIALCTLMILSVSAMIRLAKIKGWLDDILPAVVIPLIVIYTDVDLRIVPACLMLGAFMHIAGDCLTDRGCPLLWPISKRKFTLGLFTTGKIGEKIAGVIIVLGIIAIIPAHVYLGV